MYSVYLPKDNTGTGALQTCPYCGKKKCFRQYFSVETKQPIHPKVGICNHKNKCGANYTPKQYWNDNKGILQPLKSNFAEVRKQAAKLHSEQLTRKAEAITSIPTTIFDESINPIYYNRNNFASGLIQRYGERAETVLNMYMIGTSKHWNGATVFYQISKDFEVKAGVIMLYNTDTLKFVKQPYEHITWVHSIKDKQGTPVLVPKNYMLQQCFFGEHLLSLYPDAKVGIVESEKTAIIASIYHPEMVWLAAKGANGLNAEKMACLARRNVIFYPDLGGVDKQINGQTTRITFYELWQQKAVEFGHLATFSISDLLQTVVTDETIIKTASYDIADYFLQIDVNDYLFNQIEPESNYEVTAEVFHITPEPEPIQYTQIEPDTLILDDTETVQYNTLDETFNTIIEYASELDPMPVWNTPEVETVRTKADWTPELDELERFFKNAIPTTTVIFYDQATQILDLKKFVETNLLTARANNGVRTFEVYLNRLRYVKKQMVELPNIF